MKKELSDEQLDRFARRTEQDLDRLAERLDRDEEPPVRVRRGPGRPLMGSGPAEAVRVRLDPGLRQALGARARAQGVTDSELVRAALRSYLNLS